MIRPRFFTWSLCLAACGASSAAAPPSTETTPTTSVETGPAEWTAWRAARRESIAGEDGWLTLIALVWLEPGEITIGSDPASGIVLPADHAPASVGRLVIGEDVRFVATPGVEVTSDGAPATDLVMYADLSGEPTRLAVGTLRMNVIERAGRRGLRIKDQASPAREGFTGLPVYDYDPRYRVHAHVTAPDPPRMVGIVNVLGMQVDEPCAGIVSFELDGVPLSLAAVPAGTTADEGLSLMIRDATAGEGETYPAGRYLEVEPPDANGDAWVDLNYLYTPPCGYTEHATCPLPPAENEISIAIRAGERYDRPH
jgi:uncharacterized protein (DUF1684 family)